MADPVVNVNLPGEPATKITAQTPTVTQKRKTEAGQEALDQFGSAAQAQQSALAQQTEAQAQQKTIDQLGAVEGEILETRRALARSESLTENTKQIEGLKRIAAEKRAAAEQAGNIEPLLTGWKQVLAGVLQGVAQWSHTRAGGTGAAPGVEAFNAAIARDRQLKLDKFTASKEFAALAQQDVEKAELALRNRLAQIDNDHIAAGNLLKARLENMKARWKTNEARASADAAAAAIDTANAEKLARMEADFGQQVTHHGVTTTTTDQTGEGSKPTATSQLGAARAGLIVSTVKDVLASPTVSTSGLQTLRTNKARLEASRQAPAVEALVGGLSGGKVGIAPTEGEQQGLSQPDRQALSRQSVLNETVTYLTTGAAATKQEAESKTQQLQIMPSDSKETTRAKLVNAYRYAKAAATIGRQSMTPDRKSVV